jgi:O-antigen/teichoic acid export membrane protein
MMDRLHLRRNVVTSVVAFSVNIVLTFVGFRLVIQQGGTAALGLWSTLTAAIYVIRLGDVGMGGAVERHIAATDVQTNAARVRGYLDTALLINAVLFIALALLAWLLLSQRIDWAVPGNAADQAVARQILPLMLAGFVISNLASVVIGGLRGLHLAWMAAYLSVVGALVQMGLILYLVPQLGVEGLAWAQLAQSLVIGLSAWLLLNQYLAQRVGAFSFSLPRNGSRALLKELFGFSIRLQMVNLVNGLLEPASKLMVGHSAGMSVLGVYEMAYKIVQLPRNAVVSGVHGMAPALTRLLVSSPAEASALYRRARRMVTISSALVLGSAVFVGTPLASVLILGHIDVTLAWYAGIMALGFWLNSVGAPAYVLGFASGRVLANLISAAFSLCFLMVLGSLLPQVYPNYGTVIASSLALGFGGVFILWRNQRILLK